MHNKKKRWQQLPAARLRPVLSRCILMATTCGQNQSRYAAFFVATNRHGAKRYINHETLRTGVASRLPCHWPLARLCQTRGKRSATNRRRKKKRDRTHFGALKQPSESNSRRRVHVIYVSVLEERRTEPEKHVLHLLLASSKSIYVPFSFTFFFFLHRIDSTSLCFIRMST